MRGFELTVGRNTILMETEKKNITDNLAVTFSYMLGQVKGVSEDTVKQFVKSVSNLKTIKQLIRKCDFDRKTAKNGKKYWLLTGSNFGETLFEDKECKVTIMNEKGEELELWSVK